MSKTARIQVRHVPQEFQPGTLLEIDRTHELLRIITADRDECWVDVERIGRWERWRTRAGFFRTTIRLRRLLAAR